MGYSEHFDKRSSYCNGNCKYCKYWRGQRGFLSSYDSNHVEIYINTDTVAPKPGYGGCYLKSVTDDIYHYDDGCSSFTLADELKASPVKSTPNVVEDTKDDDNYAGFSAHYNDDNRYHRITNNALDWFLTIIQMLCFFGLPGGGIVALWGLLAEDHDVLKIGGIIALCTLIVGLLLEVIRFGKKKNK